MLEPLRPFDFFGGEADEESSPFSCCREAAALALLVSTIIALCCYCRCSSPSSIWRHLRRRIVPLRRARLPMRGKVFERQPAAAAAAAVQQE